jgi:hypothetical protein|tara:strand:- start:2023 stop:2343 length:321 start_codon:yes stop_codon:yes gene_type:complete
MLNLANDAFFNLNDFASTATWRLASSSDPYVVTGVFTNDFFSGFDELNAPVSTSQPQFTMKTSDIPTGGKEEDTLIIPVNNIDQTYLVKIIERDATNVSLLILQRQ